MDSIRDRYSEPASVSVTARVVRTRSATPICFSRAATIRDAVGCEMPISRPATEKLPLLATRAKSCNEKNLSFIYNPHLTKLFIQVPADSRTSQPSFEERPVACDRVGKGPKIEKQKERFCHCSCRGQ